MAQTISELKVKYGSLEAIPKPELYDSLCLPVTREDLGKLVAPYQDWCRKSADAKERTDNGVTVSKAEQQDHFNKKAAEALDEFKKHPFIDFLRGLCKRDLEFLTCYFTWETNPEGEGKPISENKVTPESHGPILDLFVKKDDAKKIKNQDHRKIRMLLWPRGGMKSTIDVVDTVQWILNFPEIRILFLTGDADLAQGFVKETKGHFVSRSENPTLMNLVFPEFCFDDSEKGNVYEFNCPVWTAKKVYRKEPTVQASSVGSGLGGRHYEVVKADDSVYDGNSANEEVCLNVARKISVTVRPGKALRFYGYLDIVGTRYHDSDYYGDVIEKNKNAGESLVTAGKCWTRTENPTLGQIILIGRAVVIKPEIVERLEKEGRPVTYIEAGESGCDLLLPDVMPYSALMGEYSNNEETFEGQMNQNPRAAGKTTFDKPLMLRSTVRFDELPYQGPMSQIWDFAGPFNTRKKGERDYCTGSNAVWNEKGVCYINDLIRDRFRPANLAKAVVDFAVKWHPFVIGIEDTGGARFLEDSIRAEALKTGDQHVIRLCHAIDWITPENTIHAKTLRMAEMHPLIVHGLLKFANFLPHLQTLYDEFERCMFGRGHDDIPDNIARQKKYSGRVLQMVSKPDSAGAVAASPNRAMWNQLFEHGDAFGRPGMGGPPLPIVVPEPEPEIQNQDYLPGVPNYLGAGF